MATYKDNLDDIAQAGLNQIISKNYNAKIKDHQHIKKIVKIAIAFCDKEVAMEYQIDEVF